MGTRLYAQYSSYILKAGGSVLGAANYLGIRSQFRSDEITGLQYGAEMTSNTISSFGGVPGMAWGLGWESGRLITGSNWYQNWKSNTWLPLRRKAFGY